MRMLCNTPYWHGWQFHATKPLWSVACSSEKNLPSHAAYLGPTSACEAGLISLQPCAHHLSHSRGIANLLRAGWGNTTPPPCCGSAPGSPPDWTCLGNLNNEASRRHPYQMPQTTWLLLNTNGSALLTLCSVHLGVFRSVCPPSRWRKLNSGSGGGWSVNSLISSILRHRTLTADSVTASLDWDRNLSGSHCLLTPHLTQNTSELPWSWKYFLICIHLLGRRQSSNLKRQCDTKKSFK